ncbi:MAG TPA: 7TM-DISM domain-containing protein, partial [Smithellaceae bacterium]|nr:7TM-DISM domain-containing protein [Smithellaceae bacterium]
MRWLLLPAILTIAFPAAAESLILKDKPCYDVSGYMEFLSDPANNLTVQQVSERNDWAGTKHGKVPNLGLTQATIWLRFTLVNQADITERFYVSLEYPVLNFVSFYTRDVNGHFREEHTGSTSPASAGVVPDRSFLFPLTVEPGKTTVVYLRVKSSSSLTLPVRILSDHALLLKAVRDYTIYGVLLGLLAVVILYFITVGSFLYKGTPIWLVLYSFFFGLHVAIR